MKRKLLLSTCSVLIVATAPAFSALTWLGTIDHSFSSEANWIDSATGSAPPGNAINHAVVIEDDLDINASIVDVAQNYSVRLGDERIMTVLNSTVTGDSNTSYLPISPEFFSPGSVPSLFFEVVLGGNSVMSFGWSWNVRWSLGGNSRLVAENTNANALFGVLGYDATLDFASLSTSFTLEGIDYTAESPDRSAFVSKLTIFGQPAVAGENITISSTGSGGTVFTPVPEPGSMMLLFAFPACLFVRKRRVDAL